MPPKKTKPNEKCSCGSGKKHKKCCMVAGSEQQTHLQEQRLELQQSQEVKRRLKLQRSQEELEILRQQLANKKEEERQASQHLQQFISQNRGLQRTDDLSSSAATNVLNKATEVLSLDTTMATAAAAVSAVTISANVLNIRQTAALQRP